MERVGLPEAFWNTLTDITNINDQSETICETDGCFSDYPPYAEICPRKHNQSEEEDGQKALVSAIPIKTAIHAPHQKASKPGSARETLPLRKKCEFLFECGASVYSLIAEFFNKEVGRKLLNRKTVSEWHVGAPVCRKAYKRPHALILKYKNFLNEQWPKSTRLAKKMLIEQERKSIDTSPLHPLRIKCEVLFKHGARSAHFITQFLNIDKRGKGDKLGRKVYGWYVKQKDYLFCAAYTGKQKLILDYCNFLNERQMNTTHSFTQKYIEEEKDSVMRCVKNLESPIATTTIGRQRMTLRSSTRSHSPKKEPHTASARGRKRKYTQAFSEE